MMRVRRAAPPREGPMGVIERRAKTIPAPEPGLTPREMIARDGRLEFESPVFHI